MSNFKNPRLILASTSVYRKELLGRLGIPFEVVSPKVDETPLAGETTQTLALRLAKAKAAAVASLNPEAWVIGSDQVADLCGAAIGKPGNFERALAQLQLMRGSIVTFHTALCLMRGDIETTVCIPTEVKFRNLKDDVLEAYLHAEEPYDCAGSAKSEAMGISLLEYLRSDDPTALIGLPLIALSGLLRDAGFLIPNSKERTE
ncbi:septum formation protein Maf [Polynucleobacter paneuropaeus]|nr:Maf family nucleotide pyrophosphatase [Polynucleobacter paneuropaeus]MBT8514608.1 septum formation protein Maf [Polynucleobacter paneuropaeus]MBT8522243.1 septum formation protein Maf [Polynucleobacter paneuropaeus]MBT8528527.1 septum formation protein Maf [Polynucleobacter paneuropaeus]MBT8538222.1 septum formation protein Maf [Polynucleobacter paneuropaeus]MBT8561142.1 septum formation protein Maf [Polynucleobacter paneuropaeus]